MQNPDPQAKNEDEAFWARLQPLLREAGLVPEAPTSGSAVLGKLRVCLKVHGQLGSKQGQLCYNLIFGTSELLLNLVWERLGFSGCGLSTLPTARGRPLRPELVEPCSGFPLQPKR